MSFSHIWLVASLIHLGLFAMAPGPAPRSELLVDPIWWSIGVLIAVSIGLVWAVMITAIRRLRRR